jgi:hypothetical protein
MQKWIARTAVLGLLLGLGIGWLAAAWVVDAKEPNKPEKDAPKAKPGEAALADLLAEALKNNPDLRVAEAKLLEAEAELRRTRLQVTQKIVATHSGLAAQKKQLAEYETIVRRLERLFQAGTVPESELLLARQRVMLAKAKLAELEAQLPFVLGRQPGKSDQTKSMRARLLYSRELADAARLWNQTRIEVDPGSRQWFAVRSKGPRRTAAEKLRKALDTPVVLKFPANTRLGDALEYLESKVPGVSFRIVNNGDTNIEDIPFQLRLKEPVPLGAAIQAIEDTLPFRFVVRDYGILVTEKDALPPNALLVNDFWKSEAADASASREASGKKNPPNKDIRGKITLTSPDGDLVQISIGSDDGLRNGNTLEVFRLRPKPVYLGTVKVLLVEAHRAVARPLAGSKMDFQVGDSVASRIKSR